jgi:hypothetical protein
MRAATRRNAMFGMLGSLTKAAVGVVVATPVAVVADVITMGGALTDKREPYTATALRDVVKNVSDATRPGGPPPGVRFFPGYS